MRRGATPGLLKRAQDTGFKAPGKLEVGLRQLKGSHVYLPGGSTVSDVFLNGTFGFGRDWVLGTFVQFERFLIPSIISGSQHNASARIQLEWNPNRAVVAR